MKNKPANLSRLLRQEMLHKKKQFMRIKLLWKLKLVLCVLLPAAIFIAAAQVLKIYLALKLRKVLRPQTAPPSPPQPLQKQVLKQETVPQESVGHSSNEPLL